MKVYVLVIDNRHGTTIDAFNSQAKLDAANAEYCETNWCWDNPPPEDAAAMVQAYWEYQSAQGDEWHKIEEIEL
jgi:hypothetical protein